MNREHIPRCLGFIMDGNRRWARGQGKQGYEGHYEGYKKLKEVMEWANEHGVAHIVVYALSTENWKRSEKEINVLLSILRKMVIEELDTLKERNIQIRFRGSISDFPGDIQTNMAAMEHQTKTNTGPVLTVLTSYGGRAEIIAAAQKAGEEGVEITEQNLKEYMWLSDMPNPDMIVRTGGEKRLSNFLLWHTAYSELHFIDTFWPALTREEFDDIIAEYGKRERRYGK